MTDEKFTELVNLYFDNEISSVDLAWLQEELTSNPARKCEFEERRMLHQAMRMALNPSEFEVTSRIQSEQAPVAYGLPIWAIASGLAACLAIGLLLLTPVVFNPAMHLSAQSAALEAIEAEEPMMIGAKDTARYSAVREVSERNRGSLTAQLRLMGLQPAMTPRDRQLHGVDLVAFKSRKLARNREVSLVNQLQHASAIPKPQLFENFNRSSRVEPSTSHSQWPSGFGTSLASFK